MLEIFSLFALLLIAHLGGVPSMTLAILFVIWVLLSLPGAWLLVTRAPPFVPTPKRILRAMLELAALKPGERAYDLGCGDGRIVFAAAKQGARAVGYELSIPTYFFAKCRSLLHRTSDIRYGNFWNQDYRNADVIFCYLLIGTMEALEQRIWPQLKPGARVVSHAFRLIGIPLAREKDGAYVYVKE